MRASLLVQRLAVSRDARQTARRAVSNLIRTQFPELENACIGFYWPIKGEIDLRNLVKTLTEAGASAALPVIVERHRPLQFHTWRPRMKLARGYWNIPVPAVPEIVQPTVLLVPLLGFGPLGYRLGYGGGYYDRTLAVMDPRPLTIGVGYELGFLESIYPQPHDIPLDAIATEAGLVQLRRAGRTISRDTSKSRLDRKLDEALKGTFPASDPFEVSEADTRTYASPPCFMHEFESK